MKRLVGCLLAAALLIALSAPALADFPDITDSGLQAKAAFLQSLGVLSGDQNGNFLPDKNLTRAEFSKMAVILAGVQDVSAYKSYTLFRDLRASHWSLGYVNAAVSKKLIQGFPDGSFHPDENITFAQAATILMRMLGYADEDVGLRWPDSYLEAAAAKGLTTGLALSAGASVPRSLSVTLFYNLLYTKNKAGEQMITELGVVEKEKTLVLAVNEKSPDGRLTGLVTAETGFYPSRYTLSADYVGRRGTLQLDADGYVMSFTPDVQSSRSVKMATATASAIRGENGQNITGLSTTTVYAGTEETTYDQIWLDLKAGTSFTAYYTATGAVDYLLWHKLSYGDTLFTLAFEPSDRQNPLPVLGLPENAIVFKNGVSASWKDLRRGDTILYDATTHTVAASNLVISGVYETASPSRSDPQTIKTLGRTFDVHPNLVPKMADFSLGSVLTYTIAADGRIVGASLAGNSTVSYPGLVTGTDEVTLANGLVAKGTLPASDGTHIGALVQCASITAGKLYIFYETMQSGRQAVDLTAMTVGASPIASHAVFYEKVLDNSQAVHVDKAALPKTIPASQVMDVRLDSAGRADRIVLKNVTGNAYAYGFVNFKEVTSQGGGYSELTVTNYNGSITSFVPFGQNTSVSSIYVGGMLYTPGSARFLSVEACLPYRAARADFQGNLFVVVDNHLLPLPEDFKVYIAAEREYVTVSEARVYANDFEIYTDKAPADGGQVCMIIAK